MKTTNMILAIVAGLAVQAMAAAPDNNPSASTGVRQNTGQQWTYPFLESKAKPVQKIEHFGGISSRPWAQTVSYPTASFVDDKNHEPRFNLFWIGARPD